MDGSSELRENTITLSEFRAIFNHSKRYLNAYDYEVFMDFIESFNEFMCKMFRDYNKLKLFSTIYGLSAKLESDSVELEKANLPIFNVGLFGFLEHMYKLRYEPTQEYVYDYLLEVYSSKRDRTVLDNMIKYYGHFYYYKKDHTIVNVDVHGKEGLEL